jgi:ABC-type glycerol-3-phosphate transport system permease component
VILSKTQNEAKILTYIKESLTTKVSETRVEIFLSILEAYLLYYQA